jgi:uncharacterized membrane protein YsdA (DUF1294 family)
MWRPSASLLLIVAAPNVLTWAAYRLDKLCARRQWRRISERTLLLLTLFGGVGALTAMYAHHHRHKSQKTSFVVAATLATLLQLAVLGGLGYWIATAPRG